MQNTAHKSPESSKYRQKMPPCRPVKGQASQPQTQGIGQADVPAADAEAQVQPAPEGRRQEDPVRRRGPAGPKGPEKAVEESQAAAQGTGPEEEPRRHRRGRHPSSRPSQPPWRTCS